MPFTIKSLKELSKNARKNATSIVQVEAYYDYAVNEETKEETYEFDFNPSTIESIDICENLFGKVPYLKLKLFDDGLYYHKINFATGKKIYIRMWPRGDNDDEIPVPYIDNVFVIQTYRYISDLNTEDYRYEIFAIPDMVSYLDNVIKYPVNTLSPQTTSNKAIEQVAGYCGIKVVGDSSLEVNDNMLWVNTNKTGKDFIKHIVNHSWVSNDDSALFYLDKEGNGHYTSIKTLCENKQAKMTYAYVSTYDAQKDENGNHKVYKKTYVDVIIDNNAFLASNGGNTNKAYQYDPYESFIGLNAKSLLDENIIDNLKMVKDLVKNAIDNSDENKIKNLMVKRVPKSKTSYSRYLANGEQKTQFGGIPLRKNPDHVKNITGNMHFIQTHYYYDYAPMHNLTMQKSFFQNFLHLTVNTGTQVEQDKDVKFREHLGDKINIEFETKNNRTSIQNGEYIICSVHHTWTREASYTILLTCVRDSITDTEHLFG